MLGAAASGCHLELSPTTSPSILLWTLFLLLSVGWFGYLFPVRSDCIMATLRLSLTPNLLQWSKTEALLVLGIFLHVKKFLVESRVVLTAFPFDCSSFGQQLLDRGIKEGIWSSLKLCPISSWILFFYFYTHRIIMKKGIYNLRRMPVVRVQPFH